MSLLRARVAALTALAFAAASGAAAAPGSVAGVDRSQAGAATLARLSSNKIEETALGALSGGQEVVTVSEQTLSAVNSGNSVNANSVVNGPVSLSANAFSGFAGIGNFVINTGNNNNLQGNLSVNITMTGR